MGSVGRDIERRIWRESAATPRLVILESPFAGDIERNIIYARAALRDCLLRGDAPLASHLLYPRDSTTPRVLRDEVPGERAIGIAAGLAWGVHAAATVVYCDLGITLGMQTGIDRAALEGRPVVRRYLPAGKLRALGISVGG